MPDLDRHVHARHPTLGELVRYDRAGKWYVEPVTGRRRHVTLTAAVEMALTWAAEGGTVLDNQPGGNRFEAAYRRAAGLPRDRRRHHFPAPDQAAATQQAQM